MANAKHTTRVESTVFLAVLSTKACEYRRFSLLLAAKDWRNVPGGEELGETTVFEGFGRPVTGDLGSTLVPEVKVETLHSGTALCPNFSVGDGKMGVFTSVPIK